MAGIWQRAMDYLGLSDNDTYGDYDAYEDQQPAAAPRRPPAAPIHEPEGINVVRSTNPSSTSGSPTNDGSSGVSGITAQPRSHSVRTVTPVPQAPKVHVVAPASFVDAQEIGQRFRSSQPVIINLQGIERDLTRRIVDFASGLVYGLNGKMEKVADKVYMLTPTDVEVSADEKRRLQERGLFRA
jgi:cell division inhibitor SepF